MLPKEETRYFYELALSFVPDVGPKTTRALLDRFEDPEAVFKAPPKELKSINGITESRAKMFQDKKILKLAEEELSFAIKHDLQILFTGTENYPERLMHCNDAPACQCPMQGRLQ